jgi:hypothetical protein
MRADTGVGPSMASGSQTCRGNCADLPTAPPKISKSGSSRDWNEACPCSTEEAMFFSRPVKLKVPILYE